MEIDIEVAFGAIRAAVKAETERCLSIARSWAAKETHVDAMYQMGAENTANAIASEIEKGK